MSLYKPLNSLILPIVGDVYWKLAYLLVNNGLVIGEKNHCFGQYLLTLKRTWMFVKFLVHFRYFHL